VKPNSKTKNRGTTALLDCGPFFSFVILSGVLQKQNEVEESLIVIPGR
jgi:hypothetical protein